MPINHDSRKAETKAVKQALAAAGIKARVGHGNGTAWGWMHVEIGRWNWWAYDLALRITQEVTGRRGEYGGNINIYASDDDLPVLPRCDAYRDDRHYDDSCQCTLIAGHAGQHFGKYGERFADYLRAVPAA